MYYRNQLPYKFWSIPENIINSCNKYHFKDMEEKSSSRTISKFLEKKYKQGENNIAYEIRTKKDINNPKFKLIDDELYIQEVVSMYGDIINLNKLSAEITFDDNTSYVTKDIDIFYMKDNLLKNKSSQYFSLSTFALQTLNFRIKLPKKYIDKNIKSATMIVNYIFLSMEPRKKFADEMFNLM